MKMFLPLAMALALFPATALAQQPEICQRVEFSQEVLTRFPNIRAACLDVITKGGQQYAVVKADLVRAGTRRVTVRVKRPDGTHSDPINIDVKSGTQVNVNGRPTRYDELAIGQELMAYISVKDPGIALEPIEDVGIVEFTPVPATPEPAPTVATAEMPKTATRLPLLGSIGILLLAIGAGLALLRRRSLA